MFERFTEQARQVVVFAQEEARILRHNYIGTEHLLLGILREENGLGASVLGAHDATIERVRAQIVRIVGGGEEVTSGQIPFTPRAKNVLELSLREALELGHNHIGTEHLLMGIARENEGVAARVLLDFGVTGQELIDELRALIGAGTQDRPTPSGSAYRALERTIGYVQTARGVDAVVRGSDAAALAYVAGAVNALRDAGVLPNETAEDWLRRLRRPSPSAPPPGEGGFSGRVLERVVPGPDQRPDSFRVLAAELYRDGCILRLHVPPGGTLPASITVADSAGTTYWQAEPTDWHGSDGVLGEFVLTPAVPKEASELRVRAAFKDESVVEAVISL